MPCEGRRNFVGSCPTMSPDTAVSDFEDHTEAENGPDMKLRTRVLFNCAHKKGDEATLTEGAVSVADGAAPVVVTEDQKDGFSEEEFVEVFWSGWNCFFADRRIS